MINLGQDVDEKKLLIEEQEEKEVEDECRVGSRYENNCLNKIKENLSLKLDFAIENK
jgi:hypothetical protein